MLSDFFWDAWKGLGIESQTWELFFLFFVFVVVLYGDLFFCAVGVGWRIYTIKSIFAKNAKPREEDLGLLYMNLSALNFFIGSGQMLDNH